MQLNTDQQAAFEAVVAHLFSGQSVGLTGSAGSGKSTLTKVIRAELTRLGRTTQFLAPTNSASRLFADGLTVTRFLAKAPYYDKWGKLRFQEGASNDLQVKGSILLVDEAWMLPASDVASLLAHGTCLFIGDPNQLPPVGESQSALVTLGLPLARLSSTMRFGAKTLDVANSVLASGNTSQIRAAMSSLPKVTLTEASLKFTYLSFTNASWRKCFGRHCDLNGHKLGYYPGLEVLADRTILELDIFKGETYTIESCSESALVIKGVGFIPLTPELRQQRDTEKEALIKDAKAAISCDWKGFYSYWDKFWDIFPAQARTIHKSQGQTLGDVALDVSDVLRFSREFELTKKLVYTGLTRAKGKLVIL
jgi:energy-coupling factor transporter ATP-binding protein EcfA2